MAIDSTKSLRLFYALWPDEDARAAFMHLQAPLQGRKTRYQNLHMTLAFLGQQSTSLLPMLELILRKLPSQTLALRVDRIGYFPRKKIAWAGMHETPADLLTLNERLQTLLTENEIAFDRQQEFQPHITLARDAVPPEELPFEIIEWQCREVALVESVTLPEGPLYRVLASHALVDMKENGKNETGLF
jgi:2'-5' RNA ligase